MFCNNCGKEVLDGNAFCAGCGTKIEGIVLDPEGSEVMRDRVATPAGDYQSILETITALVPRLESGTGKQCTVGIGMPGSFSRATGRVKNSNSVCLNGQPLSRDLETLMKRPLRFANSSAEILARDAA